MLLSQPERGLLIRQKLIWIALEHQLLQIFIKGEFSAASLLPHQVAFATIPWRYIYTTNYDDAVEKSFTAARSSIEPINPDDAVTSIPKDRASCVHLNGSIIGITPDKISSQIKLTDSSYLTASLADSEWAIRLRQDIDAAQAVFYIGYSTYDLDIARLLYAKPSLKDKSFFCVGDSANPVLKRRIEKFGIDISLSAVEFLEEATKPKYVPTSTGSPIERCIKTYFPDTSGRTFTDRDIFDLFLLGRVHSAFVSRSVDGSLPYALHRKTIDRVLEFSAIQPSAVSVHSDLGNGKTMVLEQLKPLAAASGFTVIELLKQKDGLLEELDLALKRPGKLMFLVDNYGNWMDALKFIGNHHAKNVSIVIAARSSANDVLAGRAAEILRLGDLHEVSADYLPDADILKVVQIMDTYGLWGSRASWTIIRKQQYLARHCNREWHAILVELFSAPQIKDRLSDLIQKIKDEGSYSLVIITLILLAIIDFPASTDILTDLCGTKILTVGFRQNATINELIDFDHDEIWLKSSVAGAFILKAVADPEVVLSTLIAITHAADKAAYVSHDYLLLMGSLMRFGNSQNFFPKEVRGTFVLRYYEAVKELGHSKRYPLFWLQYAIACLFIDDFTRAGLYFASAYSFAKETNFSTHQIDNHYARFLLRQSVAEGRLATAMESFREARALIFQQMRRERLHYPYRVASLISDWFDTFGDLLNDEQKGEVQRAAAYIAQKIATLPDTLRTHRDVRECYEKMQAIVQQT
jgi:hypothetical protein